MPFTGHEPLLFWNKLTQLSSAGENKGLLGRKKCREFGDESLARSRSAFCVKMQIQFDCRWILTNITNKQVKWEQKSQVHFALSFGRQKKYIRSYFPTLN